MRRSLWQGFLLGTCFLVAASLDSTLAGCSPIPERWAKGHASKHKTQAWTGKEVEAQATRMDAKESSNEAERGPSLGEMKTPEPRSAAVSWMRCPVYAKESLAGQARQANFRSPKVEVQLCLLRQEQQTQKTSPPITFKKCLPGLTGFREIHRDNKLCARKHGDGLAGSEAGYSPVELCFCITQEKLAARVGRFGRPLLGDAHSERCRAI